MSRSSSGTKTDQRRESADQGEEARARYLNEYAVPVMELIRAHRMSKRNPRTPIPRGRIVCRVLDLVGKIWALPNTVIGLMYGAAGHVIGKIGNILGLLDHEPRVSLGNNAIQFENNPLVKSAITLGNVIVYGSGKRYRSGASRHGGAHTLGVEEMQHTVQSQVLGPFYLPAHGILGVTAKLIHGYWHGPLNVLEAGPHDLKPAPWRRLS